MCIKEYRATLCGKILGRKNKVLKPILMKSGYLYFSLSAPKNKPKKVVIHRFVWEYFFGKIPRHLTVDHKNGIKTDNRLCNLQLLSLKDNIKKAQRALTDVEIRKLKSLVGTMKMKELAVRFSISNNLCSKIVHNHVWADIN